jgi:cysteine desulfurase
MIYLDWAATTPPYGDIQNIMNETALSYYGNPSSLHQEGRRAHEKLEEMRSRCAAILGCIPQELIFTSGGTESNNMIISSLLTRRDKGRVIVSGIEHPSVWEPTQALSKQGWDVKVIKAGSNGLIRPEKLSRLLTEDTKMVLIMGVHNESGVIQPLNDLVEVTRTAESKRPIHFHSDLVQYAGKLPLNLSSLGIDSASISSHKFRGPRGVGLLYEKKPLCGVYAGGDHERGLRPGTENLAGIAGMTVALERVPQALESSQAARRRMILLMNGIKEIPGARLLPQERLENDLHFTPWILNCALPPLPGEVLVRVMDEAGFALSTGSACSSQKKSRTRGLEAMGIDSKTAFSSIRISQGPSTTEEEISSLLRVLKEQASLLGRAIR